MSGAEEKRLERPGRLAYRRGGAGRGRKWLFGFAGMTLAPALLPFLCEMGLRGTGHGHGSGLLRPGPRGAIRFIQVSGIIRFGQYVSSK